MEDCEIFFQLWQDSSLLQLHCFLDVLIVIALHFGFSSIIVIVLIFGYSISTKLLLHVAKLIVSDKNSN